MSKIVLNLWANIMQDVVQKSLEKLQQNQEKVRNSLQLQRDHLKDMQVKRARTERSLLKRIEFTKFKLYI